MSRPRPAVLVAALLAAAGSARAQSAKPLEFGAGITVVSLPVFVTDKDGRPVSGLTAEDFEIEADGRKMALVGFREIDAESLDNLGSAVLARAARRQFLLLFDLSFTSVNGLVRSRKAAIEFVQKDLAGGDLAGVATYSANHGVRLILGFTSDRRQIQRAIETLGVTQLDRQADPLGLAYDLRDVGSALADTLPEETGDVLGDAIRAVQIRFERSQQAQYRERVGALFAGLEQLGRALDGVQGRKQVVLISSGFDDSGVMGAQGKEAVQNAEAVVRGRIWEVQSEDRFGDTVLRDGLDRAMKSFAASDAVVHTVDLAGLTARGDARQQGDEPSFRSGRESLNQIASLSGGRFFRNTNDLGTAFRELVEMSRRYYLLAFEPPEAKEAGKFHRLKVRVRAKGISVSHRSGYYERALQRERSPLERRFEAAEMVVKGVEGGELRLRGLAIPYERRGAAVTLPIVLELPGDALLAGSGATLALEVYGYAIDEQGAVRDYVGLASNLDLAKVGDKLRRRGLQCHATFTLPPGRYSLRFLVREPESGRSGSHMLEVTIPKPEPGEVVLYPPLLMDSPLDWVILEAASRSTPEPSQPFRVGDDAFAPRPRPRLVNGEIARLCLLAFDGGRQYDAGMSFQIQPQFLDAGGEPVSFGRFALARTAAGADGFRRFVLSITPQDAPPGDYTLRVRLRDPASGRFSEAYQLVRFE